MRGGPSLGSIVIGPAGPRVEHQTEARVELRDAAHAVAESPLVLREVLTARAQILGELSEARGHRVLRLKDAIREPQLVADEGEVRELVGEERPDNEVVVVVEVEQETEGLAILHLDVQHALALAKAGLEVHAQALYPRVVQQELDLALKLGDVQRNGRG